MRTERFNVYQIISNLWHFAKGCPDYGSYAVSDHMRVGSFSSSIGNISYLMLGEQVDQRKSREWSPKALNNESSCLSKLIETIMLSFTMSWDGILYIDF